MSKLTELAIKIAYENRANALIAAKRAADESRLEKIKSLLKGNKGKATALESGLGGLAAGGLGFGLTKALGGSTGRAWANAGIAGGGTAAGIAGLNYRKEIGQALRDITTKKLSGQEIKDWEDVLGAQPDNGNDPRLNSMKEMIKRAKNGTLPKESVRYLRDQMKNGGWTMPANFMEEKYKGTNSPERVDANMAYINAKNIVDAYEVRKGHLTSTEQREYDDAKRLVDAFRMAGTDL